MIHFLQIDIPKKLGFGEEMHLSIFMSPEVNEIPSSEFIPNGVSLLETFWEKREKHFKAYYFNGKGNNLDEIDKYLAYQAIEVSEIGDENSIKIGGEPEWLQGPELNGGPNGEMFKFLLQIPNGYGFPKRVSAPEQPDSFSTIEYCLFLGNQIYVFVSNEIDHPEAVWIVVQN